MSTDGPVSAGRLAVLLAGLGLFYLGMAALQFLNHRSSRRRAFKGSGVPRVTDSVADFIYTQDEVCCLQGFH